MSEHAETEIVRDQSPLMLRPNTTVMQAARQMHSRYVSAVLVTDEAATLLGIFTERDAISRILAAGRDAVTTTLAEVMTNNPETVSPQHTAVEVLRVMREARCRHLPVIHDGKVVGMVARNDFPGSESAEPG